MTIDTLEQAEIFLRSLREYSDAGESPVDGRYVGILHDFVLAQAKGLKKIEAINAAQTKELAEVRDKIKRILEDRCGGLPGNG